MLSVVLLADAHTAALGLAQALGEFGHIIFARRARLHSWPSVEEQDGESQFTRPIEDGSSAGQTYPSEKRIMRFLLCHSRQGAVAGTNQRFRWQAEDLLAYFLAGLFPRLIAAPH